jgi:pyrroline-5-carboxylate reductase
MMRVAILGTGNMGKALIAGLQQRFGFQVQVQAWDLQPAALQGLSKEVVVQQPHLWFAQEAPQIVIVAVKPPDVPDALRMLATAAAAHRPLWCSIAAGVTVAQLEQQLGPAQPLCRVMPNTPALVGQAMSAFVLNPHCTEQHRQLVREVFEACGRVVEVNEKQMDAVTGLSGSGPAYGYLFIEALIEGGVTAGLPYDIARELAVQTVAGAAAMVLQTAEAPAVLKARVMSPGGTTACGLAALEQHGFKYAVIKAVQEATRRSRELGA